MTEAAKEGSLDPVIIKKYANRRLYDTRTSKYIVLSDVVEMVKEGREFVIEDAKTGDDLTRTILNQIIFEQETRPQEFLFPLEFQKQLIRMYGDGYQKLIPDFLTQSLSYFVEERNQMAQAWQDLIAQNTETFLKQSEAMARQNMELFRKSWDVFGMGAMSGSEAQGDRSTEEKAVKLQEQIDALQSELDALKSGK